MTKASNIRETILAGAQAATRESEHRVFTRLELARRTGLPSAVIGDYLKRMVPCGEIDQIKRGVFSSPQVRRPDETVYVSVLCDGSHKIECGDRMMIFSLDESRLLKLALGNAAVIVSRDYKGAPVSIMLQIDGRAVVQMAEQQMELSAMEVRQLKLALG